MPVNTGYTTPAHVYEKDMVDGLLSSLATKDKGTVYHILRMLSEKVYGEPKDIHARMDKIIDALETRLDRVEAALAITEQQHPGKRTFVGNRPMFW